ncbi:MAG: sulfotransferase [Tenacibaculum sp.]|nr:sulfotransferase [Tenacibaculum sp.]
MSQIKKIIIKSYFKVIKSGSPAFIMGHMRSGSSLLEHILSSNSSIIGSGEQARIYESSYDFQKSEFFARVNNKTFLSNFPYFTDQVLHHHLTPNLDFLKNTNGKYLFLIRDPHETLSSMKKLKKAYNGVSEYFDYVTYYQDRIKYLINFSKKLESHQQIFVTYEDIVTNTDETLVRLSEFLKLKEPLTPFYKLKKTTGILGDRSENIKKQSIQKTKKELVELDNQTKEDLYESYNAAIAYFRKL